MSENSPRKRNTAASLGESRTTEMMKDKKAYKTVTAPKSWKLALNYGVPAVAVGLFVVAVATGYYDMDTFKSLWLWFFRILKGLFAWDD